MEGGEWRVKAVDGSWCALSPLDEASKTLASLTVDEVVWIRKQDLTEVINAQREALT